MGLCMPDGTEFGLDLVCKILKRDPTFLVCYKKRNHKAQVMCPMRKGKNFSEPNLMQPSFSSLFYNAINLNILHYFNTDFDAVVFI